MGEFRVLHLPKGATKDASGREFGDDWAFLPIATDDGSTLYVTTDHVRASEVGSLVPGTGLGLARLVVRALHELRSGMTLSEWSDLLTECDHVPGQPVFADLDGCCRWATDGACAIREGWSVPGPTQNNRWSDPPEEHEIAGIRMLLDQPMAPVPEDFEAKFHPRFREILMLADEQSLVTYAIRGTTMRTLRLDVHGLGPVAFVMPLGSQWTQVVEHGERLRAIDRHGVDVVAPTRSVADVLAAVDGSQR